MLKTFKRIRLVFFAVAALLLTGCVPVPHREFVAPRIKGNITHDGLPVVNAKVILLANDEDSTGPSFTDESGFFSVGPVSKIYMFSFLIGDPVTKYKLLIMIDDKEYVGYARGEMGHFSRFEDVYCDLAKLNKKKDFFGYEFEQYYCIVLGHD